MDEQSPAPWMVERVVNRAGVTQWAVVAADDGQVCLCDRESDARHIALLTNHHHMQQLVLARQAS